MKEQFNKKKSEQEEDQSGKVTQNIFTPAPGENFGLDFLKNDDSSYHKQFFDEPVSSLEVTYSDLTNIPTHGKSRLTDTNKLNYSNEFNSNEGNNKLVPPQKLDHIKSEQMNDSQSMKTSKLNSLLGNMTSKVSQNEKPNTIFEISRKEDPVSSKKQILDKVFP